MTAPRTAFVLGGGGILGATQIGMLRALLERDLRPDLVLGTSIGAVNGAFLAADPTLAGLTRLSGVWADLAGGAPALAGREPAAARGRRLTRPRTSASDGETAADVRRERRGRSRRPGRRVPMHLYPPGRFLRMLRHHLPVEEFGELAVPFQCVAASVERSVAHWFSAGPIAPAVLASCAVPGIFPPIQVGDEHFLDGGLVHSIPVGRAVALGAERIFVLHVGRVEQPLEVPRWPWEVAQVTFEIARRHRYVEEMASLPDDLEVHALPSGADDAPTVSFLHANERYVSRRVEAAYDAAGRYLDRR